MKKVLSILSLIAVFATLSPAYAGPGKGHVVHAGPEVHHRPPHHVMAPPPPPPRYYRGSAVIGGVLARRSCWGSPYCNYRLGWYDDYYYQPCYRDGVYINFGIPIRF